MGTILALDTSGIYPYVGLFRSRVPQAQSPLSEGEVRVWRGSSLESHSEELASAVSALYSECSEPIAAVYIGEGPGSFTGLRIGYALAKGIASAHRCPLGSISSFQVYAQEFAECAPVGTPLWVIGDAGRGELFWGTYITAKEGVSLGYALPIEKKDPCIVSTLQFYDSYREMIQSHSSSPSPILINHSCRDLAFLNQDASKVCLSSHVARSLLHLYQRSVEASRSPTGSASASSTGYPDAYSLSQALAQKNPFYLRSVAAKTIAERVGKVSG